MNHLKNIALCLTFSAAVSALTGCEDDPAKRGGTYTAARHMGTGSNIPQRTDIYSTDSVAGRTESSSISATNNGAAGAGGLTGANNR